jgi:hypothetical protein
MLGTQLTVDRPIDDVPSLPGVVGSPVMQRLAAHPTDGQRVSVRFGT